MKTKKVITGTVAAAILSLSVCAVSPIANAADETVQISVGKEEAKAGEQFTVDVTFAGVPSTGIQGTDFAIEYDSSVLTIDAANVKAGAITKTGAEDSDPSASSLSLFNVKSPSAGILNIDWSTQLDSTYWIKSDGVFCTITGTVSGSAKAGTVASIKVIPVSRETYPGSGVANTDIECGYNNADGTMTSYGVAVTNGSVTVKGDTDVTTQPTSGGNVSAKRGDANEDTDVSVADPTLIMQAIANPNVYGIGGTSGITEQGAKNADVADGSDNMGGDGMTSSDALKIQRYLAGSISEL